MKNIIIFVLLLITALVVYFSFYKNGSDEAIKEKSIGIIKLEKKFDLETRTPLIEKRLTNSAKAVEPPVRTKSITEEMLLENGFVLENVTYKDKKSYYLDKIEYTELMKIFNFQRDEVLLLNSCGRIGPFCYLKRDKVLLYIGRRSTIGQSPSMEGLTLEEAEEVLKENPPPVNARVFLYDEPIDANIKSASGAKN